MADEIEIEATAPEGVAQTPEQKAALDSQLHEGWRAGIHRRINEVVGALEALAASHAIERGRVDALEQRLKALIGQAPDKGSLAGYVPKDTDPVSVATTHVEMPPPVPVDAPSQRRQPLRDRGSNSPEA
jgi:hypothetical protein